MQFPQSPFYSQSNDKLTKETVIYLTLVIRGRLDPDVLHRKALELVAHWPILGGSLDLKSSPYSISKGSECDFRVRELRASTLSKYSSFLGNMIKTRDMVRSGTKPWAPDTTSDSSLDDIAHFNSISRAASPPTSIFTLRVTILDDATIFGFRVPHYVTDGTGLYEIVKAYSNIVAGNSVQKLIPPPDINVPISQCIRNDGDQNIIFSELLSQDVSICKADEIHTRGIWPAIKQAVNILIHNYASFLQGMSFSNGYVYLPREFISELHNQCQKEVSVVNRSSSDGEIILSKLDVLVAWFLKVSYKHMPPESDEGPFDLIHMMSYRFCTQIPGDGSEDSNSMTYLRNSHAAMCLRWSSFRKFQAMKLAQVALAVRALVNYNKSESSVKSFLKFYEVHVDATLSYGPKGARVGYLPVVTSWTTFPYFELDFSSALEKKEPYSDVGHDTMGKVVFVDPQIQSGFGIQIRPIIIVTKDSHQGISAE
ncbi:hypothetical protein B7463_g10788, partial [Scytalidium lignicola]